MTRLRTRGAVFVDTSALLALVNSDDALHRAAIGMQDALDEAATPLVTSEWVLMEFLNHTSAPPRRRVGIQAIESLRELEHLTVHPVSSEAWSAAFDLYCRRPDQAWSLVDCTSILICEEHGIRRAFTHDRHFKQAGFEILLR